MTARTHLSRFEADLELKFADEDAGIVTGYGAVFSVEDKGGDVIEPGAFAGTLSKRKQDAGPIPMLWQHDPDRPIGLWTEVREDARGLYVEGKVLKETSQGRDAWALMKHGVLRGMSIGYRALKSARTAAGLRLLKEVDLWEVSIVTFPMNDRALIDGMKFRDAVEEMTERDLERTLRDAGLSAHEAKAAVHRAMTLGAQREAARAREAVIAEQAERKLARLADILSR